MNFKWAALCASALVLCAPAAGRAEFKFKVPAGWVDLSPTAPPANFKQITPELAAQLRAGHFAFFAADLKHAGDGFMENVNVTVEKGVMPITELVLAEVTARIDEEVKKQAAPGVKFSAKIIESSLVQIDGATCGRYVGLLTMGSLLVQQIGFLIPGHGEHAVVTYSTVPTQFKHYQPIFDAAARATKGAEQPR